MLRPRGMTRRARVLRVRNTGWEWADDVVTVEEPLEIRLLRTDGRRLVTSRLSVTMRTPGDDFDLALGFLFTEGIVPGPDAVQEVTYCAAASRDERYNVVSVYLRPWVRVDTERLARHFYSTSSCGTCGKASLEAVRVRGCRHLEEGCPRVPAELIRGLPSALRSAQRVFRRTGGLHAAGLFRPDGTLVAVREDVGRHNAVDKLVGAQLKERRLPLSDTIMAVSGRAGFEIVQKALVAGIPVVVAVGAPSSLAVELAREFGMTLAGFTRPTGFNVYADAGRVVTAPAYGGRGPARSAVPGNEIRCVAGALLQPAEGHQHRPLAPSAFSPSFSPSWSGSLAAKAPVVHFHGRKPEPEANHGDHEKDGQLPLAQPAPFVPGPCVAGHPSARDSGASP